VIRPACSIGFALSPDKELRSVIVSTRFYV
jgi:hypothetical protein